MQRARKETDVDKALNVCDALDNRPNEDVDADIRPHIQKQIQDDPKLAAWPLQTQQEIEQILGSVAN